MPVHAGGLHRALVVQLSISVKNNDHNKNDNNNKKTTRGIIRTMDSSSGFMLCESPVCVLVPTGRLHRALGVLPVLLPRLSLQFCGRFVGGADRHPGRVQRVQVLRSCIQCFSQQAVSLTSNI